MMNKVRGESDEIDCSVSVIHELSDERYAEAEETGQLTQAEVLAGWHFCCEFDWAIYHRDDVKEFCSCFNDIASVTTTDSHRRP